MFCVSNFLHHFLQARKRAKSKWNDFPFPKVGYVSSLEGKWFALGSCFQKSLSRHLWLMDVKFLELDPVQRDAMNFVFPQIYLGNRRFPQPYNLHIYISNVLVL